MSDVKKVIGIFGCGGPVEATTIFGIVRFILRPALALVEGQQPIQYAEAGTGSDNVTDPLAVAGVFHTCVTGRLPGIVGGIPPVKVPHEIVT